MNNIHYKLIPLTNENIELLENIRYNAFGIDKNKLEIESSFYAKKLKEKKYIVFGVSLNNQLVGACYISNYHNSLYIEQLFILKKYQKTKLHLGTNLLKFILSNKKIVENYFNTKFYFSYLENYKDTSDFYKTLGYEEKEFFMRKRL